MVKSMYAGVAGLRSHQTKMDVIGNNIANVNTYGFKSARITFKDQFYQTRTGSANASGRYGGSNPSQIGYGTSIAAIAKTFTTGGISPTDTPLDCMINGNGFFIVGPNNGSVSSSNISSLNLTRMGEFTFDGNGNLVDANKNFVYGFTYNTGSDPATFNTASISPIRIPTNPVYPYQQYNLDSLTIGADGTITGIDADSKAVIYVGKIALANVPNPNALEAAENSYYQIRNNTGTVRAFEPGSGTTGLLIAGALELSNVDLAKEFTEMITTQRGFQANTRVITVTDEMLSELVNIKR